MAKVVLDKCRLVVFSNQIWTPKAFEEGQQPKFSCQFLFAPDSKEAKAVQAAISEVAKEKWKDKAGAVLESLKGNTNKFCFQNGNNKPDYDAFPGNLYLGASNDQRPTIKDRNGVTPLTQADGRPYSGCYVRGIVDIWAQDNKWGKGVRAKLLGIQFLEDGDAFTGGASVSEDDFTDLSDGADAPDLATGTGGFV